MNLIQLGTLSFYKTCHECSSIFFFFFAFSGNKQADFL